MKTWLSVILVISATKLFAQTTVISTTDKITGIKEKITVLKSDKTTREGKYTAYYVHPMQDDELICEGIYKSNQKEGLWQHYSRNGKLADSGRYEHGQKRGTWSAYGSNDKLQVQYDYSNNKLLFFEPTPGSITKAYNVIVGTDTVKKHLERPPVYLTGSAYYFFTLSDIRFPKEARVANFKGRVVIAFTIDENGKVSNYRVKEPIGSGCDGEALRVVKNLDGDWLPGLLDGKPVAVELEVSINFQNAGIH